MRKWGHKVEVVMLSEKSSANKQRDEIGTFQAKLDALGADGCELVPYGAVPMRGTYTNNIGYAYLSLFKRPGS